MNIQKEYTKNIEHILSQAVDSDYQQGITWYKEARLFCYQVSKDYSISFRKVCAILAALSPRNKWARNKSDCIALIEYLTGCSDIQPKIATYGGMIKKATIIFNSRIDTKNHMIKLLNGQKITAFFLNIYDVQSDFVTVDSWMQLISLGKYIPVEDRPPLKKSDYKLIEIIIRDIAALNKINPPVLQAILWTTCKRLNEQKDYN